MGAYEGKNSVTVCEWDLGSGVKTTFTAVIRWMHMHSWVIKASVETLHNKSQSKTRETTEECIKIGAWIVGK